MSKISTLLSIIFAHIIHTASYLMPRSNTIWVCIGWHNSKEREIFADNSKYFFLHLQNEHSEITSVYLTRDRALATILTNAGFTAYYNHSLWGIYYALRAHYTIVDARITTRNWKFSGGSCVIQLWHGKGMKKSGHDGNYNNNQNYFTNPSFFLTYDKIIATSDRTAALLSGTFSQPTSDMVITGQPRTDVFYREIKGSEIDSHTILKNYIDGARAANSNKVILYAPTFRADGSSPLAQFDWGQLNTFLIKHNYHFIIGLHPKFGAKTVEDMSDYSHIFNIPPGFDSYPYFNDIDAVITDYSNIYIDFLLLDKPVFFFTYDEAWYRHSTGLHEDFDTLTPGPHITTQADLESALAATDGYQTARSEARVALFAQEDGGASARIFEALTK